jgi:hypothetical protein
MFLSYGQERRYDAELADAVTDDLELAPSWAVDGGTPQEWPRRVLGETWWCEAATANLASHSLTPVSPVLAEQPGPPEATEMENSIRCSLRTSKEETGEG